MAQFLRLLDSAQPDTAKTTQGTLRGLSGETIKTEDLGPAGGLHAGGLAEQDRACRSPGVLIQIKTLGLRHQRHAGAGSGLGEGNEGEEEGMEHQHSTHMHGEGVSTYETQTYNCSRDVHVDIKASRGEEKTRETGPKPIDINEQAAWKCGDPIASTRASKPRRSEIRKARGIVRRVKGRQRWALICEGMAMALAPIEPTEN